MDTKRGAAIKTVAAKVEPEIIIALRAAARENCRTVSGELRAMLRARFAGNVAPWERAVKPVSWQAAVVITPRLLDRDAAAAYLSISVAALDQLRASGEIATVAMPGRLGKTTRRPLYDRFQLDKAIERWQQR